MHRLLVAVVVAALLLGLPSVLAEPEEAVDELLNKDRKDPAETAAPLRGAADPGLVEEPLPDSTSFLGSLLAGAAGLVGDIGNALAQGVAGVAGAVGDLFAAVALAAWTGLAWTAVTAWTGLRLGFDGTLGAILWSVGGVWGLMTGTVTGSLRLLALTLTGIWTVLEDLAVGVARLRPAVVPETAWAGIVATSATGLSAAAHFGLLNGLKRFGWLGAGAPLFTRIAKDDILDHPLRATIFDAIRENPGIHISALARQVDAGWGTTIHHLRKLQEKELVAVRMVNNQKCFFQNGGTVGRSAWTQIPELKNDTADRIARYVLANPLSPVTAISEQLGISPSLVSHHVRKLERAGVVEKHRHGRFVKLTVTQEARANVFGELPAIPATDVGAIAA